MLLFRKTLFWFLGGKSSVGATDYALIALEYTCGREGLMPWILSKSNSTEICIRFTCSRRICTHETIPGALIPSTAPPTFLWYRAGDVFKNRLREWRVYNPIVPGEKNLPSLVGGRKNAASRNPLFTFQAWALRGRISDSDSVLDDSPDKQNKKKELREGKAKYFKDRRGIKFN